MKSESRLHQLRERLHEIIFEADTPEGKAFDVGLIAAILASVLVVMLESVPEIHDRWGGLLYAVEWIFTVLFTVEYLLRLYSVRLPWKYATSFFGIVDLLSILPTYLSLFVAGTQSLLVIRALRLLRVFRIFRLVKYSRAGLVIMQAMRSSRPKILVFFIFVVLLVTIIGAVMYLVEGGQEGSQFTSIPRSVYWAIVTLTTVGYGDITPITPLGQFLSAIVMILGYSVIAVPTGIVTAELFQARRTNTQACRYCAREGHDDDAVFCKYCGARLNE